MVAYLLRPPIVMEGPAGGGRLFSWYRIPQGISLLVTGSTVVEHRSPDQDQMAAADVTYLGGHEYVITDAAAQILIEAGHSDLLEPFDGYIDVYEESY